MAGFFSIMPCCLRKSIVQKAEPIWKQLGFGFFLFCGFRCHRPVHTEAASSFSFSNPCSVNTQTMRACASTASVCAAISRFALYQPAKQATEVEAHPPFPSNNTFDQRLISMLQTLPGNCPMQIAVWLRQSSVRASLSARHGTKKGATTGAPLPNDIPRQANT